MPCPIHFVTPRCTSQVHISATSAETVAVGELVLNANRSVRIGVNGLGV